MYNNAKSSFSKRNERASLALVLTTTQGLEMTDEELIQACQDGRKRAVDLLLKRHHSTLCAMVRKRFPELRDISDVVQEAQIRVWRSLGQLRNASAFKAWLNQIVTNLCYDELRKKVRSQEVVSLDETVESEDGKRLERFIVDTTTQPDTKLQRKELSAVLEKALDEIPQDFREPVLLREIDGLSYEEIAAVTNTELGTVKSRISRARTKIQKQMAGYLSDAA